MVGYGIGFADGERAPVFAEGMLLVSARVLAVGIAVTAVLIVATGMAQAKPSHGDRYEIQRANVAASLYLGKKGGYRVALYLPNERTALFYVYKIKRDGERSAYFVNEYAVHNPGSLAHGVIWRGSARWGPSHCGSAPAEMCARTWKRTAKGGWGSLNRRRGKSSPPNTGPGTPFRPPTG